MSRWFSQNSVAGIFWSKVKINDLSNMPSARTEKKCSGCVEGRGEMNAIMTEAIEIRGDRILGTQV